jgi:hypothetical protein
MFKEGCELGQTDYHLDEPVLDRDLPPAISKWN